MIESNVEFARRGYEAALRGDLEAIREMLDPEVKWHGGDLSDPRACHNREQALAFMRGARSDRRVGELVDVVGAGDKRPRRRTRRRRRVGLTRRRLGRK